MSNEMWVEPSEVLKLEHRKTTREELFEAFCSQKPVTIEGFSGYFNLLQTDCRNGVLKLDLVPAQAVAPAADIKAAKSLSCDIRN